ncbi:iron dicitrate transport regulator FecR, partial [Salmonella enterica]|nr:iron dicitrate transport regulator FecR [Salmonella enterica]
AGSQAEFSRAGAFDAVALRPEVAAWLDGMLLADAMPLADFLAELGRYRPGVLRCSPDAASLRVVGAFPVADTDQVLAM